MATKPSKFQSIFQADEEPAPEETTALVVASVVEAQAESPPLVAPDQTVPESGQGSDAPRRTGRPATGKKSDPNYRQVTAYVRKDLYRNVTDALYDQARGRDTKRKEFSELVDELLERWWQERTDRQQGTS